MKGFLFYSVAQFENSGQRHFWEQVQLIFVCIQKNFSRFNLLHNSDRVQNKKQNLFKICKVETVNA